MLGSFFFFINSNVPCVTVKGDFSIFFYLSVVSVYFSYTGMLVLRYFDIFESWYFQGIRTVKEILTKFLGL